MKIAVEDHCGRVEVYDVVANDEHAVGPHVAHAERGGGTLRDNTVLVFQISDGKPPRSGSTGRPVRR
jgi:hypothetical protein